MKTLVSDRASVYDRAAEAVCALLKAKPDAAVTLAAGRTMLPLWERLGELVRQGKLSFSEVRFFQTAEFIDAAAEKTFRHMTEEKLLTVTDLKPDNCFWLSEKNLKDCDEAIAKAGGLDLAVLGLGNNAHIGFNEPATQYDTRCRIQKLTPKTRQQYSWLFGSAEAVPEKACTLGIHTLVEAKKILVLALGEEKAQATFDMLYARDDSIIPAAFLQLPFDVTVFADTEAGAKL